MPTLDISPAVNGDDGQVVADTTFDPTDAPTVGDFNGDPFDHWLRFPNVTIPQGATVDVAYITFNATSALGSTVLTNIYAVDEDDHAAPTNLTQWNTDHGIHTTASVAWDFTPAGSGTIQTPSIVSVIQEIIDRAGWASGNDIGIHVDDDGSATDNAQQVGRVEDGTEATLHIEYTAGTPATVTLTPATLTATPQSLGLSLSPLSVSLTPATISAVAQTLGVDITGAGVEITLQPATIQAVAQALAIDLSAKSVTLSPAALTLAAQVLTVEMVDIIFNASTFERRIHSRLGEHGLAYTEGKIVFICESDEVHETNFVYGNFSKVVCSHGVGIKTGSGDGDLALFRRGRDYPVTVSERTILEDAGYSIT